MVSDLGYKKVYLTNILRLSQAKVWEQQRILRPERAAAIAQDKLKHYDSTVGTSSIHMPGVITMFEIDLFIDSLFTKRVSICDAEALRKVVKSTRKNIRIFIIVYEKVVKIIRSKFNQNFQ